MTTLTPHTVSTLPNNLRLLHSHCLGEVEHFGVIIDAGSRDEDDKSHGLAHFVEHTIFKGTTHRKAWHILNRMETIGGELNAYTTKEETVIYTAAPKGNLRRAAQLIADLITDSTFPDKELKKEKDVIDDEISSYLDTPSEAIFDELDEHIFAGSSMAHNILGNHQSVAQLTSRHCRQWIDSLYTPTNMVVFYAGPATINQVYKLLMQYFGNLNHLTKQKYRIQPPVNNVFDITHHKSLHQAHTIAAKRIPYESLSHRLRFSLVSNILGGPGMNSLLNVQMREKRALVYSVDSTVSFYSDCALLAIYYGCDPEDEHKCRNVLYNTIQSLAQLTPNRLEQAKKQFLGQLTLARQNNENTAISQARTLLRHNTITPNTLIEDIIHNVSYDNYIDTIKTITEAQLSFLTYTS